MRIQVQISRYQKLTPTTLIFYGRNVISAMNIRHMQPTTVDGRFAVAFEWGKGPSADVRGRTRDPNLPSTTLTESALLLNRRSVPQCTSDDDYRITKGSVILVGKASTKVS